MSTASQTCSYSDVAIGQIFLHDQVAYRKMDDSYAEVVNASESPELYHFYAETKVIVVESSK